MKKIRAVGIVLHNTNILLVKRRESDKEYFVFPGGGVEINETVEEAVVRELLEESSISVKINKLLYKHLYDDQSEHHFYLCDYLRGEPVLGEGNEKKQMEQDLTSFYQPVWISLDEFPKLLVYPLEIKEWIIKDISSNFKNTPRIEQLQINNLKQTL